ncbi:PepSY domain-containing protein [Acinetobacter sp. B10A]|uniref:PepSY-associated TM helix domain-containing protein n=1 Tax=Acinetobacter baretiae TaxID=2605383 RepID=UPI001B3C5D26|nr:PepSY-associated TM helix domain-containing protein [Acinetobacter baretiae]MBF7685398.1 PepSY domain-containing protein [Acinetobacter baretiae]
MKIRSDLMKLAKSMHTWVGISAGILLFICFFAGGLSMFQHQISQWATPQQQILPTIKPEQYNELIQQVQAKFPATQKSFLFNIQSTEHQYAPLIWTESEHRQGFNLAQHTWLASLDSHGQLITQEVNLSKAGWLIEQLHETAGIPGMVGHHGLGVYVMGIVAILYFLALMTGLILLLPTLVKDYFAVRTGKNKKRFWLDAHNIVGITSLPFHIIICTSVIVFAFHDLFYASITQLALNGKPAFGPPKQEQIHIQSTTLDIQNILLQTKKVAPEYTVDYIEFSNLDQPQKAAANIALYSDHQMLRSASNDFVRMNPYLPKKINYSNISTQTDAGNTLVTALFSLHFGSYGGYTVRWIYFIFGIGGAFLFYSGNILWIESRAKKQKFAHDPIPVQRKDVRFFASLTIGMCLGCIFAITGTLLLSCWFYLIADIKSMNHFFLYSYYIIFLFSIAYTFIVGYAKALPHLFAAIALSLILMPLTSFFMSSTNIWLNIITLCTAFIFFNFYQKAQDRAHAAPKGSLWAK